MQVYCHTIISWAGGHVWHYHFQYLTQFDCHWILARTSAGYNATETELPLLNWSAVWSRWDLLVICK